MGIFDALTTAVTGLQAQSFALQNISGNIANSQTTAFKRTDTSFEDLVTDNAPIRQVAGAVLANSRPTNGIQGSIQTSAVGTFMAIQGAGYFVVQKPTSRELREIFRLETERAIANDWVVRHEGRYLQLHPGQRRYGPTQSKALVCEWEDGAIEVYYRKQRVSFSELKEPIRKIARPIPRARAVMVRKAKPDHPWRQGYQNMKPRVPNPVIAAPLVGIGCVQSSV